MTDRGSHWIQTALKKPEDVNAAVTMGGKGRSLDTEHEGNPDKSGRRARLAKILMNLNKKG